jgi:hypothetical protein
VFDSAVVCGGGTEDRNNKVVEESGAQGCVREVVRGFQFRKTQVMSSSGGVLSVVMIWLTRLKAKTPVLKLQKIGFFE